MRGKNDLKEYVIVLKDTFTKFVYSHHTINIDTEFSIKGVEAALFLFGVPTRIIADKGRYFGSSGFREFCSSLSYKCSLIQARVRQTAR